MIVSIESIKLSALAAQTITENPYPAHSSYWATWNTFFLRHHFELECV